MDYVTSNGQDIEKLTEAEIEAFKEKMNKELYPGTVYWKADIGQKKILEIRPDMRYMLCANY